MLPFEMCLSKSDFETFHFQAFEFELFDFQRVVDFETDNLELTFEIWLWKFEWQLDLESFASLKIWRWKLDLKFDVWNLSFEIGLWQKFDFGNFTFDLWIGLLTKVDFWKLTVVEMSLWKVDFCLVLHEFFDLWLKMLRPETATIKQKQLTYCLLPGLT